MNRQPKTRHPRNPDLQPPVPRLTQPAPDSVSHGIARQIDDSSNSGQPLALSPEQVIHMQHAHGNQFVLGLLRTSSASVQRTPTLDSQATVDERKELRILSAENLKSYSDAELEENFGNNDPPSKLADDVQFDPQISAKLKNGLQTMAAEMSNAASFTVNTIANVPMDLSKYGGVNGVYRFTYIQRKSPAKTRLIIEQVSAKPPAQLNDKGVKAQEKRFKALDFKFGTGFTGDESQKQLYSALARVPDNILEHARGVTFSYSVMNDKGASGEPGHYDPNTHTIQFFKSAMNAITGSVDAGGASRFIFAVIHEIGHAVDYEARAKAKMKVDALTKSLEEATKKNDQTQITQLKTDLNNARQAQAQIGNSKNSDSADFKGAQGKGISRYGGTAPVENYAELFSMYVLDPDLLKSIRPEAYEYFKTNVH